MFVITSCTRSRYRTSVSTMHFATSFLLVLCCRWGNSINYCGTPPVCLCSGPVFSCRNITFFPMFNDYKKAGVLRIDLFKTQVTTLPEFSIEIWPRLKCIDVRTTPNTSCQAIEELQRPGLTILSDCLLTTNIESTRSERPNTPKTKTVNTGDLILISICIASLILGSGALYYVQGKEVY